MTTTCVNNPLNNRIPKYISFYTLGTSMAVNLALLAKQIRYSLTRRGQGAGVGGNAQNYSDYSGTYL